MEGFFYIGELARRSGLSARTIRYYEKRGLIRPRHRARSGYRLYGAESLQRVVFIQRAKELGLTLAEIRQIIELHEAGSLPCECTRGFISEKIRECDRKIRAIQELRERLKSIQSSTHARRTRGTVCPIITP